MCQLRFCFSPSSQLSHTSTDFEIYPHLEASNVSLVIDSSSSYQAAKRMRPRCDSLSPLIEPSSTMMRCPNAAPISSCMWLMIGFAVHYRTTKSSLLLSALSPLFSTSILLTVQHHLYLICRRSSPHPGRQKQQQKQPESQRQHQKYPRCRQVLDQNLCGSGNLSKRMDTWANGSNLHGSTKASHIILPRCGWWFKRRSSLAMRFVFGTPLLRFVTNN